MQRFKYLNLTYSSEEIIGEATIVDCVWVDESFKKKLLTENSNIYKDSSGYGFVLKDVKKFSQKISCKGHLNFWELID